MTVDERLDRYLPDLRCAEITVFLADGSTVDLAQANPVGDVAHFPLGFAEVGQKLSRLLGDEDAVHILSTAAALPTCPSVIDLLDQLP